MNTCLICQVELATSGLPKICAPCAHSYKRIGDLNPEAKARVLQAKLWEIRTPEDDPKVSQAAERLRLEFTKFSQAAERWCQDHAKTFQSFEQQLSQFSQAAERWRQDFAKIYQPIERLLPQWEQMCGPGTPWRDLMDLSHIAEGHFDWITPEEQDAAIKRLVAKARVTIKGKARQALRQRAMEAGMQPNEYLQQVVLPAAVLLVVRADDIPRRLQIGRHIRIRNLDRKWQPLCPFELVPRQYLAWFWPQVSKAASAVLLDHDYPQTRHEPLEEDVTGETFIHNYACSPEAEIAAKSVLRVLWNTASPQQKKIMKELLDEDSVSEIASRLEMSRSSVHTHLKRLQAKVQEL